MTGFPSALSSLVFSFSLSPELPSSLQFGHCKFTNRFARNTLKLYCWNANWTWNSTLGVTTHNDICTMLGHIHELGSPVRCSFLRNFEHGKLWSRKATQTALSSYSHYLTTTRLVPFCNNTHRRYCLGLCVFGHVVLAQTWSEHIVFEEHSTR